MIEFKKLTRIEKNGVRHYDIGDGLLVPSITTVLSAMSSAKHLIEWRARVGEEEANKISRQAALRGTRIHQAIEDYLKTGQHKLTLPLDLEVFKQFQKEFEYHLQMTFALEASMYSKSLLIAGTCDMIARWDGEFSIVDFKTSRSEKEESDIDNYFIQATAYSLMLEEMKGVACKQLVIIIGSNSTPDAKVFVQDRKPWIEKTKEIIASYHIKNLTNS